MKIQQAADLYAAHGSYVRVAEALTVSPETARRWLHAAGVRLKAKGPKPSKVPPGLSAKPARVDVQRLTDDALELLVWRALSELNRRSPGIRISTENWRDSRCVTRQFLSHNVER